MLPKWLTALLVLLHEAWSTRRDAHIRFLKLQVEMFKERLPGNRVILDPVERRRLMKIGDEVDHKVEDPLGIVSIKTHRRWQAGGARWPRAGQGRPATADQVAPRTDPPPGEGERGLGCARWSTTEIRSVSLMARG